MPCSPQCRFEALISRFAWDHILVPLVTLTSIILHRITNKGVRCILAWECCHNCSSWKNILLSHTFPHKRIKSGATQHEQQHYMGRKLLPWKSFSHEKVQFHTYGCIISMGFLDYVIKRSTAVWFKGVSLYFRSWWEFCWIWPWNQKPFSHK